jgi:hypothetical protein
VRSAADWFAGLRHGKLGMMQSSPMTVAFLQSGMLTEISLLVRTSLGLSTNQLD